MRHDEAFKFRVRGPDAATESDGTGSMNPSDQATPAFDPEAVHDQYRAERAKRMTEGRADIHDLTGDEHFAEYRAIRSRPSSSANRSPRTSTS